MHVDDGAVGTQTGMPSPVAQDTTKDVNEKDDSPSWDDGDFKPLELPARSTSAEAVSAPQEGQPPPRKPEEGVDEEGWLPSSDGF